MGNQQDWIGAVEENLFEVWECLAGAPGAEYDKNERFIRYIGGIPFPLCNSIMRANLSDEGLAGQIEAAAAPILTRSLPLFWWIGPVTKPADLGDRLAERGLTLVEEVPGMAIDLRATAEDGRPVPPDLTIRGVETGEDLAAWLEIFRIVFEMPETAVAFFGKAMKQIGFRPEVSYRHYLGLWQGEPVACSSVYLGRSAAGIYNVATLPAFRGRGIGVVMSRWTLKLAKERGFEIAVLHASAMGRPVYEKLGFVECCRLTIYLWQPPA